MFDRGIWEKSLCFHAPVCSPLGFGYNEGGGGEAEKYLRLLSAQGMSGGASRQENTLRLAQWGHITSIMPQHVCQRGTVEYRAVESWKVSFM